MVRTFFVVGGAWRESQNIKLSQACRGHRLLTEGFRQEAAHETLPRPESSITAKVLQSGQRLNVATLLFRFIIWQRSCSMRD